MRGIISIILLVMMGVFFLNFTQLRAQEQQATYVGIDKCKICHPKNYAAFMQRKFSRAWRVLEMRKKTNDPQCLKCHTTGYGKPGGFVDEKTTPYLKYKQCEACHGPGSLHANNPANETYRRQLHPYRYSKENICISCHRCMFSHREGEF